MLGAYDTQNSDWVEKLLLATSFSVLWVFSICSYLIFEEFVPWFLQSMLRQSSQKCQNFSVACWFLWGYLILIKTFSLFALQLFCSFSFFGFCLCSSLTMCLFRLKAELNVLEHSLHRCLSATLTFFSLTKVPKQQLISPFLLDFHFVIFFSRGSSHVNHIHTLMYVWFHIYHNSKIFSPCQASVRAPASYVCWHLTWLYFRKGIFHICAFSGF